MRRVFVGLAILMLALAACGGTSVEPSPSASASPTPGSRTPIMAFFMKDGVVAPVRRFSDSTDPSQRLLDAVEAMLEGPTAAEARTGYATAVPAGTRLRALNIRAGAVAVDLSREFESGGGSASVAGRLAQLVFTATQVELTAAVTFTVEGVTPVVFTGEGLVVDHAVGRDSYEQLSPPVLILTPLPGDEVTSPVRVAGTANVFEAQFSLDLVAGGQTVTVPVRATSGTGTRGGFAVSIDAGGYRGAGRLVPWDASPRDGSRVESPAIPIVIT